MKPLIRAASIRWALAGVLDLAKTQPNIPLLLVAMALVGALGLYLKFEPGEWSWIGLFTVLVWAGEAFNTAIEYACDAITKERHPLIGKAKDVAAGGVPILSVAAMVVVGIVVGRHLVR